MENPKTYGAVFAGRKQKASEGAEAYAAELKKLYDKAHAHRDAKTRDEDLLRRFLDGLLDSKAGFHVEFVKNPHDIDEAVDEVINYQEVKKKQGPSTRMVKASDDGSTDDSDEESQLIARLPGRPPKKNGKNAEIIKPQNGDGHDGENGAKEVEAKMVELEKSNCSLMERLEKIGKKLEETITSTQDHNGNRQPGYRPYSNYSQITGIICFKCNRPGHYARDCFTWTSQQPAQHARPVSNDTVKKPPATKGSAPGNQ